MRIGSGGSCSTKARSADIAGGFGDTFRRSRGGRRLRAEMLGVHHERPDAGAYLRVARRASTRRHPPCTAPASEGEWRRSHFAHHLTLVRPKQACRPPRERARARAEPPPPRLRQLNLTRHLTNRHRFAGGAAGIRSVTLAEQRSGRAYSLHWLPCWGKPQPQEHTRRGRSLLTYTLEPASIRTQARRARRRAHCVRGLSLAPARKCPSVRLSVERVAGAGVATAHAAAAASLAWYTL